MMVVYLHFKSICWSTFLAGIIPGLMCAVFLLISGYAEKLINLKLKILQILVYFLVKSFVKAIPALTLPVIIVGELLGEYLHLQRPSVSVIVD